MTSYGVKSVRAQPISKVCHTAQMNAAVWPQPTTKGDACVRRIAMIAAAIVLLLVGGVLFPLPIPLGAPLVGLGIILLIAASPTVARLVTAARHRSVRFDQGLRWLELHVPQSLASILRKTR